MTVTATFTWIPSTTMEKDPPPKSVYIAESGGASWQFTTTVKKQDTLDLEGLEGGWPSGALRMPSSGSAELTQFRFRQRQFGKLSNGKGRFVQIGVSELDPGGGGSGGSGGSASNGLGSGYKAAPDGHSGSSNGSRLKKVSVDGNTATTESVTLSASTPTPGKDEYPSTAVTYGAQIADFGIFRSTGKGAVDMKSPNFNKDRDEYIDENGVRYGHTTYSYNYESLLAPAIKRSHYNWQTFGATLGAWAIGSRGTWSPSDEWDRFNYHRQFMDFGSPELVVAEDAGGYYTFHHEWSGEPTNPQQQTITYTLTDTANNTNDAYYKLTLHDEWEVKDVQDKGVIVVRKAHPGTIRASNPIYDPANPPKVENAKYGYSEQKDATQEEEVKESKSAQISADSGFDAGKATSFLSAKGIDFGLKGEAKMAIASENTATTLNKQGYNYTFTPSVPLQPGQTSRPLVNVWAHQRVFKVWHWSEAGFEGESFVTVNEFDSFEPRWENPVDLPRNEGGPTSGEPN